MTKTIKSIGLTILAGVVGLVTIVVLWFLGNFLSILIPLAIDSYTKGGWDAVMRDII